MLVYLLVLVVVVIAALLAFGGAALLHLHGTSMILFIVVILLLGLAAAAIILYLHFRAKKQKELEEDPTGGGGATGDLDVLLNDASRKLRTSQQGAKSLETLPLMYVLGESNVAKTTMVLQSGLDPELLAGTAPRGGDVVPTAILNLWFTTQSAIVEVGEAVRQNNRLLARLVERTRPKAYRSAFSSGAAPRAAIVCVSADQLLRADAAESLLASANAAGSQLRDISRLLGAALPVYVIVTKLDRVPHFDAYVRNLSNDEVAQILGNTLPKSEASAGVYVDRASRELGGVLDALCYSLGEFRVEMLDRETEAKNAPGVYEFPREFSKLRKNLNQYLVELCKPSHLSANPYLRGFYFTGIRAQVVQRMSGAPVQREENEPREQGATRFIDRSLGRVPGSGQPVTQAVMESVRVPQWTFLPRLFPQVILGDKSALSATQQTAPARLFRRILFGCLALSLCTYLIFVIISYFNNAALEHNIQDAAAALPVTSATAILPPSLADLQALEKLRQTMVQLDGYKQDGAPWTYRLGLYQGDKLDDQARRIYFDRFRPRLLNPTQAGFISYLRALPDVPTATDDSSSYIAAYNPLRAYLITTSNPEKSVPQFLTPVFVKYWLGSKQTDSTMQDLAQKQVNFYGNELLRKNPYAINPDTAVRDHARVYLSNFLAETRIYQDMLSAADKTGTAVDFNKQFPGSAAAVVDGHIVRGAFTKSGFGFMQGAIQHPESYLQGEPWVLGNQAGKSLDSGVVSKSLGAKYTADFIKEWHTFLIEARVVSCGNLKEAPARLNVLAGPASPMLQLFYTVSHNTAVSDPQIQATFQPARAMVDPNATDRFIGPGNTNYINALLALYGAVNQVATAPTPPTDPTAYAPITQAAAAADIAAKQTAQAFNVDPQFHTEGTVLAIMEAPIACAAKLPPSPGAAANGGGAKICGAINPLLGKYPFSPNSTTQATPAEVNQVFAPESGTLWSVYNGILKPYLVLQGTQYVAAPAAPQPVNPKFVQYFNRAAQITSKLYPPGSQNPTFSFTPRMLPSKGVEAGSLVVDGQKLANGTAFSWNGATTHQATVAADSTQGDGFQGTWALFLLAKAGNATRTPTGVRLDFPLVTMFAGQNQTGAPSKVVSFELSGPGAELLVPGYFSGLSCGGPVVK